MTITPGIGATEQIGELAGALAKAQTEFKSVLKDTKNPYYNSMYADLSSVIGATQGALAKNGLVVIQNPVVDCEGEKAGVTTIIAHASGQWMSHDLMLPATMKGKDGVLKFDAQSVGSAITYARRYSYQAIIGIAAETDDDGNAAAENGGSRQQAQSVADRKIAEYKAKQKPTAEDESVVLTPWKQGRTALSGKGLPIIRAALAEEEKRDLGIMLDVHNKVVHIPAANAFRFTDACTKHNVAFIWMDSQTKPTKAVIPAPAFLPVNPVIEAAEIIKANPKKANSKPWLSVTWDGKKLSCFEVVNKQHMKPLWDLVLANIGKPADFVIKESGKYLNIEGIKRLNGHDYAADQTALDQGTLEPEPEFLESTMEP